MDLALGRLGEERAGSKLGREFEFGFVAYKTATGALGIYLFLCSALETGNVFRADAVLECLLCGGVSCWMLAGGNGWVAEFVPAARAQGLDVPHSRSGFFS